jgi:glyceraldehyde-3-phosphate dehydrogenase (NAD(P))
MARIVRVGINGYGVIGKRVADAVRLQDNMELVGIADVVHDYRIRVAVERGYPVFASDPARRVEMEAAGIPVVGTLDELLGRVEIVVDCTPKRVGAANRERYLAAGLKAVWQGGESHEVAGYSFVAQVNYAGALGRDSARVVSCNTTALSRVMGALHSRGWVKRVRAVLVRRATDPWESHVTGMINTVMPETKVPSHQGPDVQKVIPELDITTVAGSAAHDLSHVHFAMVETTRPVSVDDPAPSRRVTSRSRSARSESSTFVRTPSSRRRVTSRTRLTFTSATSKSTFARSSRRSTSPSAWPSRAASVIEPASPSASSGVTGSSASTTSSAG